MYLQKFYENTSGNDYVVGDIHGCFSELRKVLEEVIKFDLTKDRLFSVGDLVDRGPESIEATQWLKEPWFYAIRGNHEQMAIDYALNGRRDADLYRRNGGQWFLDLDKEEQVKIAREFCELPYAMEIATPDGKVGLVHAELPADDWSGFEEPHQSLIWGRTRISHMIETSVKGIHKIFVGHTPLRRCMQLGNVYYIDTGAVFPDGHFTIINLSEHEHEPHTVADQLEESTL